MPPLNCTNLPTSPVRHPEAVSVNVVVTPSGPAAPGVIIVLYELVIFHINAAFADVFVKFWVIVPVTTVVEVNPVIVARAPTFAPSMIKMSRPTSEVSNCGALAVNVTPAPLTAEGVTGVDGRVPYS